MPYIKVIDHNESEGKLKEIYDNLVATRGKLAEVHKIQSLNPKSIVAHMDLYMAIMFGKSPLKRYQREMVAVIVSAANNCKYCITHHAEALNHFWKNQQNVDQLIEDYTALELPKIDQLLCKLAYQLTVEPNFPGKEQLLNQIRTEDFEDRGILDTTLIIGYFNFVNRIVLGLGVELEADGGAGYEYD